MKQKNLFIYKEYSTNTICTWYKFVQFVHTVGMGTKQMYEYVFQVNEIVGQHPLMQYRYEYNRHCKCKQSHPKTRF